MTPLSTLPNHADDVDIFQPAQKPSASDAALHQQIFRYAEDLQEMIERHEMLQTQYNTVIQSGDQLVGSRAVFEALTHNSQDIHLVTDASGAIIESNPAAALLAPKHILVGTSLQEWILPEHRDNFRALSAAAAENGSSGGQECELSLRRADPAAPALKVMAQQVVTEYRKGAVLCLHWVLRDVSLRHESALESKISSLVFKSAAEGMMITDTEGIIIAVNPAFTRLTGYSAEEATGRNTHFLGSGLPDATFLGAAFWRSLRVNGHWQGEMLNRQKNGESHPVWLTIKATYDTPNQSLCFLAVFSSLPQQLQAGKRVMITDPEGTIIAVNRAFTQHTGYSAQEAIGCNPRFRSSGLQDNAFYVDFWRSLRDTGRWQGELFNRKKSGEIFPERISIKAARDINGNTVSFIAEFTDIPNLLNSEHHLSYLAHHDALTGLPNRLLFQDRIGQVIAQSRRSHEPFTLIFIDLDNFKTINDTLGHAVGDRVLQEAARRLSGALRDVDTVARLGGDEFVIIAPGLVGDAFIGRLCLKAIAVLHLPIQVIGQELSIGASFGCAEYPRHGSDDITLLQCADAAMYQAKAAGGNTYAIYAPPAQVPGEIA
jgi:diguanylate cyclase (GGDEF)-like protein/PAS domain S-box-containing protein